MLFITQWKHIFMTADGLLFLSFFHNKLFSILGVPHNDPFLVQIEPKKQFLRGFTNFFSELLDCNTRY